MIMTIMLPANLWGEQTHCPTLPNSKKERNPGNVVSPTCNALREVLRLDALFWDLGTPLPAILFFRVPLDTLELKKTWVYTGVQKKFHVRVFAI